MFRVRSIAPARPYLPRFPAVAAAGVLALALTGCTGRGGGQLPSQPLFSGAASFAFSFSCEDKGGLNPPTGRLRIQLSYHDHGTSLVGSPFSIHGVVDRIDPVVESMFCSGQEPPPGQNELIFLGRYRLTSSPPAKFPSACAGRETESMPSCRFEVIVRDNDRDRSVSARDYFHIKLSSGTALVSEFEPATVFYTRGGALSSGNLTVD